MFLLQKNNQNNKRKNGDGKMSLMHIQEDNVIKIIDLETNEMRTYTVDELRFREKIRREREEISRQIDELVKRMEERKL